MTLKMYDAVDVDAMPAGADAYAGYVSGDFVTFPDVVKEHFPAAHCFSISPSADHLAECLDVEAGDATPDQVLGWLDRAVAAGIWRPCFYAARENGMAAVQQQLAVRARDSYRLWVADQDGVKHIPAGFDGCQYDGSARDAALKFDTSALVESFFKPKPAVKPHGLAHAAVEVNLASGRGHVRAEPGTAHWGPEKNTIQHAYRLELRKAAGKHDGHWTIHRV